MSARLAYGDLSNGKEVRIRGYLDPEEALKAARLQE